MEIKTADEVELLVCNALRAVYEQTINGKIYLSECRPQNSCKEDAVVHVAALDGNEVQEGYLYVYIFVRDIDMTHNVPNKKRLMDIQKALKDATINILREKCVNFDWNHSDAPRTDANEPTHEHYSYFNIHFKTIDI